VGPSHSSGEGEVEGLGDSYWGYSHAMASTWLRFSRFPAACPMGHCLLAGFCGLSQSVDFQTERWELGDEL